MRLAILGFLIGIAWLQRQPALPPLWWWPLPGMALALVWLVRHDCRHFVLAALRTLVLVTACAALGAAWAGWRADLRLADNLPPEWEARDVDVIGAIASLPRPTDRGVRFEFDIEQSRTPGAVLPPHISLAWYDEVNRKTEEVKHPPPVVPGERWRLTLRLRRPHGTQNPHGFDFEAWALEGNIRATGYVRAKGVNERQAKMAEGFMYGVDRLRMKIRDRMLAALPDEPYRGVLVALAIGQQSAIPAEQWKVFTRTGTGHLMSISGLHITMVASLLYWLAFRLWGRAGNLALRLPAPRAAAVAGALAALAYALIAGFSVPTQRTFFMLAAVAVGLGIGRRLSGSRILAAALLAVLLFDPWAVMAPGFWLSFGCVAMIFFVTAQRTGTPSALSGAVRTQIAVTLGLLPMTLALFQEVSLISPIANAFAIPLVSLVVVPITLVGALVNQLLGADLLLLLAHLTMSACYAALAWLSSLSHIVWQSHTPPLWAAGLALAGVMWLLAPRGMPGRTAALMLTLPLFLIRPEGPKDGELWVHLLDVGQGLATVVRTARHTLVYDTGPSWNPDADSGNRIIVPFLRGEGVVNLDALIVTHADDDHSGGARSVIDARKPAWVMSSMAADSKMLAGAMEVMKCELGDSWRWDGVDFDILHPTPADYDAGNIKTNDMGCVLKITAPGGSILMTADIEKRSELALLARDADTDKTQPDLAADVLVIPHHGSKTSSTEAFLDAVKPKTALMALGYRNRFRHPHPSVTARYQARGIDLARTDEAGAITLKLASGQPPAIERYRDSSVRYWRDRPLKDALPAEP